jgi:hypothetical protein
LITHDFAQINHYITRSYESFSLKLGKPSTAANKNRYTERFLSDKNRNEEQDQSALRYADKFEATYAEVSAVPGVMKLHHQCCMDYVVALSKENQRPYKKDLRWHHHRDERDKLEAATQEDI